MPPTKITILISGSGTNLQALIDATRTGTLSDCEVVRVISSTKRKYAYGLTRAHEADIPTTIHAPFQFKKRDPDHWREEYGRDLATLILHDQPDLIVCAGYMLVLPPTFLQPIGAARIPIINLHPAAPGAFDGANAIARAHAAWRAGEIDRTAVMIHYVIEKVDRGEPIVVQEIPFESGDEDIKRLEERIHAVEHRAIVDGARIAIDRLWRERQ